MASKIFRTSCTFLPYHYPEERLSKKILELHLFDSSDMSPNSPPPPKRAAATHRCRPSDKRSTSRLFRPTTVRALGLFFLNASAAIRACVIPITSMAAHHSSRKAPLPAVGMSWAWQNKMQKRTTAGIRCWSPTQLLIGRKVAYLWKSGRGSEFSTCCGRTYRMMWFICNIITSCFDFCEFHQQANVFFLSFYPDPALGSLLPAFGTISQQ
ncbi:hypothetical protein IWX49DRAFT_280505 [Phyllosticta citricarpa]|uniref:Uncharacterized protein n=1 Tax=Phyllosticta paracitricarpa TaxID=2016321 RepID=A0ABR1NGU1_9PEZI